MRKMYIQDVYVQRIPNADGILALLLLSGSTARIDNSWPLVPNCSVRTSEKVR